MKNPIEEITKRIVKEVQPDKILLFSSQAKKNPHSESDYDICVLKKRALTHRIYRSLIGVGAPVDIIVETPSRFEELKTKSIFN